MINRCIALLFLGCLLTHPASGEDAGPGAFSQPVTLSMEQESEEGSHKNAGTVSMAGEPERRNTERNVDARLEAAVRRFQQRYTGLRDFQAEFVQTYRSRHLPAARIERGMLYIKLPDLMRWNYLDPEIKEFVLTRDRLYFYEAGENLVTIYDRTALELGNTPLLFLTGQGDLTRDFRVSATDEVLPLQPDHLVIELIPSEADASFDRAYLELGDDDHLRLHRLLVVDPLGDTTEYRFTRLRENPGLSDSLFSYQPPSDAEIWDETGAGHDTGEDH